MTGIQKVMGLMSGTSLDGVDAALLETDGEEVARPGPALTMAYPPETRALLRSSLDDARDVAQGAPVPEPAKVQRLSWTFRPFRPLAQATPSPYAPR